MADLLSTGISGVRTYQRALATVGNNIANVDTEGYSRQRLEIVQSASSSEGSLNIGNGARAVRVQRSYDSFVVENLRSSQSQLHKHQATLEYVTQLENILADKQLSLSTSLDGFFSAVQEVSLSPSSVSARQNMLNVAKSTVEQFTSVGTQLSNIEEGSYSDLTVQVNTLNQFAEQLASVNASLNRVNSIDKQPNELLDRRDTLIQDMSKLLRVHAVEKNNGSVDVHIGDVASGQYLVQGKKGSVLGIERSAANPDEAVLMIDPYMSPQKVTQVVGGSIAGISEFRQNSLTILRDELDTLTQVFVGQVNDTHALGIDAQGNFGKDLFSLGNIYTVTPGLNKGTGFVTVSAVPNTKVEKLTMELSYSDSKKLWTLTDTVSKKTVTGNTELTMGGVKFTLTGVPKDADTFSLTSTKRPIDALQVSVTKHTDIASGGPVSLSRASTNTSGTRMTLNSYVKPKAAATDTTLDTALRNNIAQVTASSITASNNVAFVIPANTQNSQFYSTEQNVSSNIKMQVFTRAGKQLFGSALTSSEQAALVTTGNGFRTNATYDSTYNNQTGSSAYMDANVTVTNPTLTTPVPATATMTISGSAIKASDTMTMTAGSATFTHTFAANANLATSAAAYVAAWNASTDANVSLYTASNSAGTITITEDTATTGALTFAGSVAQVGVSSNIAVATAAAAGTTGVKGDVRDYFAMAGSLQEDLLVFVTGTGSAEVSGQWGDLAGSAGTAATATMTISGAAIKATDTITMTVGSATVAHTFTATADLATSTSAYVAAWNASTDANVSLYTASNAAGVITITQDTPTAGALTASGSVARVGGSSDILVATAAAAGTTGVAPVDVREQLRQNIDIQFASDASTYVLTDTTTNTNIANGSLTAGGTIEYNGWKVSFDGTIQANDKFSVRGNSAQAGDNRNLLKLIDLQDNKDIFSGRGDFTEVYTDVIGDLGNSVVQSAISRDAQQIIFDQAQAKRDETSAVSLDEEAADMLRFQQAYQASAQIIQTATKLFDTILGIR